MPFPAPPWDLRARAWVSVFALRRPVGDRRAGAWAAALVDYTEPGVLAYHELLVARLLDLRGRRVRVEDLWVDSAASLEGGRALWALPKQAADLPLRTTAVGPASRTAFGAVADGRQLARGAFTSLPGAALVRTPYAGRTVQQREDDGTVVETAFAGSARVVPCRASWRFGPGGPLGFLAGRRPVLSLHLVDARLRFG